MSLPTAHKKETLCVSRNCSIIFPFYKPIPDSYYSVIGPTFHALTVTFRPTQHNLLVATHFIVPDMFWTSWCFLTGSVFRRLLWIYIAWVCVR